MVRFVDKTINDLDHFNPFTNDSQKYRNSKMARKCLNSVRKK